MTIASLVENRIFRLGNSGDGVKQIQLALAKLGYPLSGTGNFMNGTLAAVRAFQRKSGLDPDGDVGSATARAIDAALAAPKPATNAPALVEVGKPLWLQESLAHIGLKEGAGAADNRELIADIQKVAPDYQHDATPWCAGWVSYCLVSCGVKPSESPLWALSYADGWGIRLAGPALGAIAVKTRNGGGHVTFVAGRTTSGALACCGGNQNDMVNVSVYRPEVFNKGFYWPKSVPVPSKIGISSLPIVSTTGKVLRES